MAELADAPDLGSGAERCGGSTPSRGIYEMDILKRYLEVYKNCRSREFHNRCSLQGIYHCTCDMMRCPIVIEEYNNNNKKKGR